MEVCSFLGHRQIYDADIDTALQMAVNQVVDENEYVNFLLQTRDQFLERCLLATLTAKARHPTKVTLTLVATTIDYDYYLQQDGNQIPVGMIDKIVIYDVPDTSSKDCSIPYKRSMQWMIKNSTHLICYLYKNLFTPENHLFAFAQKKATVDIINISNPETEQFITESAAFMPYQARITFNQLNEGRPYTDIKKNFGGSSNRVRQTFLHERNVIFRKLEGRCCKDWHAGKGQPVRSCGIFNIGENTPETEASFRTMIRFLISKYNVRHFYVEHSCVQSSFAHALTAWSIPPYQIRITAITSNEEWDDAASGVCPPCDASKCVGQAGCDTLDVIKVMVNRTDFCVCNFSATHAFEELQKYISKNSAAVMLDIGKMRPEPEKYIIDKI